MFCSAQLGAGKCQECSQIGLRPIKTYTFVSIPLIVTLVQLRPPKMRMVAKIQCWLRISLPRDIFTLHALY